MYHRSYRNPCGEGVVAMVQRGRVVRLVLTIVRVTCVAVILATSGGADASERQIDPAFRQLLPALASSTWVPIVLPAAMPGLYAEYASLYASIAIGVTTRSRYQVELGATRACAGTHSCEVADFIGELASVDATPLGPVRVDLAHDVRGYFKAGRCGASCGASRLEWLSGRYRYGVFVKFEPEPSDSVGLANAMIAGLASIKPRLRPTAIEYGSRADQIGLVLADGLDPRNTPSAVAVTDDGAVWFRETFTWHPRIGRFAPDGSFRELQDPYAGDRSYYGGYEYRSNAFFASGNDLLVGPTEAHGRKLTIHRVVPDGTVDVVDASGCLVAGASLGCFASHRGVPDDDFAGTDPNSIVRGPRGDLWFTNITHSLVGRIAPSGRRTIFHAGLSRYDSGPQYITTGPDGNMWFTEQRDRIGRVTQDGKITEFSRGIPRRASLGGIIAGPDGNLWFTLYHGMVLGKINVNGRITLYRDLVYPSDGHGFDPVAMMVRDRTGRLYYNEGQAGRIARVTVR